MKKTLLFTAAIAGSLTLSAQKADSLSVNLQQVSVTANLAKLYSSEARILQVIGKQEIEKLPVTNLDELLETVSGIDIRNRGVGGTQADISIRGGSFDQVLILLNGVNITDPHTGHYNLDIPVELSDIQRIEILQGSAARIYGQNAFSGAINIITESTENQSISAQVSAGSFNTFGQNVSVRTGNETLKTFASFSHKNSDGHIYNTDYKILNAFSQTIFQTKSAGKFDLQLAYQQKNYGANGFYGFAFGNQNEYDNTKTFYGSLNWHLQVKNFSVSVQAYSRWHYDHYEWKKGLPAGSNRHLSDINGGKIAASYFADFGKISLGTELRNEHIFSTNLGLPLVDTVKNIFDKNVGFKKEDNRFLPNIFVDYALNINKLFVSAGVSGTFSEKYGNFWSGGADISYKTGENLKLFLSANTASHLPTFTDLYYNTSTNAGNADLKPEHSTTVEAGTKFDNNALKFNVSAFYRLNNDMIDWVRDTVKFGDKKFHAINYEEMTGAFGADFLAEYHFKNIFLQKISLDYSFVNLNKEADGFDSQYALDYLKHKVIASIEHKIYSAFSASWKAAFYDRTGNYTENSETKDYLPFATLDLRLQWQKPKYSIYLDFNNLTNTNYVDYGGLAQPKFNFLAGVKIRL